MAADMDIGGDCNNYFQGVGGCGRFITGSQNEV